MDELHLDRSLEVPTEKVNEIVLPKDPQYSAGLRNGFRFTLKKVKTGVLGIRYVVPSHYHPTYVAGILCAIYGLPKFLNLYQSLESFKQTLRDHKAEFVGVDDLTLLKAIDLVRQIDPSDRKFVVDVLSGLTLPK